jgi:hypothetical protein
MPRKSGGSISAPINDQEGLLISPLVYVMQEERNHLQENFGPFFLDHCLGGWKVGLVYLMLGIVPKCMGFSVAQKEMKNLKFFLLFE